MRSRVFLLCGLLCVALLLFTACGTGLVVPNVEDRPESGAGTLGYEPPSSQTAVSVESEETEQQPPAFWRGQSHTLPGTMTSSQPTADSEPPASVSGSTSAGEPQSSSASTSATPSQSSEVTTTEPPHTTASTPDPQGGGRGDAFEVIEKSGNGTKEVQCTPFY